jgi:hypothetical protein
MVFEEITGHDRVCRRGAWNAPGWMTTIVVVGQRAHAMRLYKPDLAYPTNSTEAVSRVCLLGGERGGF